jgi:hypothetical protein
MRCWCTMILNIKSKEINGLCLPYISNPDPVHVTVLNRHVPRLDVISAYFEQQNLINFVVQSMVLNRHMHSIDVK